MNEQGTAWVWSQYRGLITDEASAGPLPLFGRTAAPEGDERGRGVSGRLKRGAALAAAMTIGLFFPKIAGALLLLSALMLISGVEPERFDQLCRNIPGGGVILGVLAFVDSVLS
ncbi:MAG: hypothetical protein ACR652_08165 [Methylocystis sp.]|uniref:hypothetical protein n=1 Tax=Methylocystis sp. TaxID=1911079 RepID=UPI003DA1D738